VTNALILLLLASGALAIAIGMAGVYRAVRRARRTG